MTESKLVILNKPQLPNPRLVLSFSGWMDGGEVSTKTVSLLTDTLNAKKLAEIKSDGFYIYNFPSSLELASVLRPNIKIIEGIVQNIEMPANTFHYDQTNNLILFSGKEPHLLWEQYCGCIFELCSIFGVKNIYSVGSFAGLTPHTREPRIFCTVSDDKLKKSLINSVFRFTNYEGPAGITSFLLSRCRSKDIDMTSLAAEIPAYIQGYNPRCILTAIKYLCVLLGIHIDIKELQSLSDDFEKRLSDIVQKHPDLAEKITHLEQDYDDETFDSEMGDLKDWLEQKGIRVD